MGAGILRRTELFALALLVAAPVRAAVVSCDIADNLCVGNPCVTAALNVASPCEVDFGDRTLVIDGTIKVPEDGLLSLKAGSIVVRAAIVGHHSRELGARGASITLISTGGITVRSRIDASGRSEPGTIQLIAGGDIALLDPLRASTYGRQPTAPGGTIIVDAGGTLTANERARIRARGALETTGGVVNLSGRQGVHLKNRIRADGSDGGSLAIYSSDGDVVVEKRLDAGGMVGDGGGASILAVNGQITILHRLDVQGAQRGGNLTLAAGGSIQQLATLRADSAARNAAGGSVSLVSRQDVTVAAVIDAGGLEGGDISISSLNGAARVLSPVVATGNKGAGGRIVLTGATDALIASAVDADGGPQGGEIEVIGHTAVSLTAQASLFARGDMGGVIQLSGTTVTVPAGARVLVDGELPGGTIRLAASDGDLVLDGDFDASGRTGGRIEGTASGDVVASGDFAARGNGCIGLSGSAVDVTGASFDVPLVQTCP